MRGFYALLVFAFLQSSTAFSQAGKVMTVLGEIDAGEMGVTLAHEHAMVDFIGADQVSRERYDADEVFETVLPYLQRVKELGCETFVECTPAFIGRDAALLKRLAQASGLHILTNTGLYGAANDKFVPPYAYEETAEQLAQRWIAEYNGGIEGTGIRPGFIKIGVDSGALSEIDKKLVKAAALTHLQTGLTIAAHTGDGVAALDEIEVVKAAGCSPSAWIWVHAQNERNVETLAQAAGQGAWIEMDGLSPSSIAQHLLVVKAFKEKGLLHRILLSHDAGWYSVGEPGGGNFRMFDILFTEFVPKLKEEGFSDEEIRQLTVENPARAFRIEVRTLSGVQ